jgi:hypothetical protein
MKHDNQLNDVRLAIIGATQTVTRGMKAFQDAFDAIIRSQLERNVSLQKIVVKQPRKDSAPRRRN